MRIIAGELRGRNIKTTSGPGYRPAMSKVRGALFSMLESRGIIWPEARVLDVFAGSGSLGFEALSRGAIEACFIELLPKAAALIIENSEKLAIAPVRVQVLSEEAGKVLGHKPLKQYDVIFIDPPYGKRLLPQALNAVLRNGWLAPGGIINAEIEIKDKFEPEQAHPELAVVADRVYGQTRVVLWSRKTEI